MREEKKGQWSKETLTQQSRRAATLRLNVEYYGEAGKRNVLRLSIRRGGHRENDLGEQNHREKEKEKEKEKVCYLTSATGATAAVLAPIEEIESFVVSISSPRINR